MSVQNAALLAFNRGLVSKLALARTDLKRTALSAQVMNNWMPRVLGSMMLRPGLGFLGDSRSDLQAFYIPFVFSLDDKALIELTDQSLRIWINDAVLTRVAVGTTVTNGDFGAGAGWTDLDEAGATSTIAGGTLNLVGTGTNAAIREQQVTVAPADLSIEHALRIIVLAGPVTLRVGNASGNDAYVNETVLDTGIHSLAFTPTTDIWIRFSSTRITVRTVDQCTVETAGAMVIATPWLAADLRRVRYDTSGDITYLACKGTYQQRAIERRAARSWSVVLYAPEDGPFLVENVGPITIAANTLTGSTTLTASKPLFRSTHVGALFRLTSVGQTVTKLGAALNDATASIRVTGVGTDRAITIVLSGFFDGVRTMILERSFDDATWTAVAGETWVAAVTVAFNDGLDNQIVFYRLKISVIGGAGTTTMQLSIPTGSITGVARVNFFTSTTSVTADIITALGSTTATDIWAEGAWSDFRGYPSSVAFHQSRLWWAGKSFEWGSVSDGFYSFDDTVLGDSGPIIRSIGFGPIDNINWLLAMQRLFLGGEMTEFQVVTSSLDEPVTPTNFQIRPSSTQGSAPVAALKIDARGIFVRRSGTRVFELALDAVQGDYSSTDLTAIVPDLFEDETDNTVDKSIVRIAVQRLPDTRVHCVMANGTVAVMIFDKVEQVNCWITLSTDGDIEDVAVLPGTPEDQVYYSVKRTINGSTKRYLERWATEAEARGGTLTKLADSFVVYNGAAATVITGLSNLEGENVAVWADGVDVGTASDGTYTYTVSGGQITLDEAASIVIVGMPYVGRWQSAKLAYAARLGTALTQKKNVSGLGMIMVDTHAQGVKYGPNFDTLDNLPQMEDGAPVDPDKIWSEYDKASFVFPGQWDTDSRVCLQAASPRPCTISALVVTVDTNEKS